MEEGIGDCESKAVLRNATGLAGHARSAPKIFNLPFPIFNPSVLANRPFLDILP
jgi:hypothetical protein